VTALAMVVTAKVIAAFGGEAPGAGLALEAVFAGLGAGALCGLLTGLITTQFKIAPFIVTLGMLEIARGGAKWLADSSAIYPPSTWLNDLMRQDPSWPWYKLASGVWLMLALVALVYVVLKFTVFGRYVQALGSNEQTARLCGIKVDLHRCSVYVLSGLFAGLAGVLYYGNLSAGDSTEAVGMELQVIAAVIIGGASLSGGEGNSFGTATGALIMVVLANGCTMLDVPMYVQNLIVGVVIIAAVGIDRLRHRIAAWNG
jgi:ribose/xylose/arabinose/galactoside ABC-type transport system permease subunit